MKSTTIRISLEAYRLIRDTVAATGERPGDVVLRALKGAYQPVAQTPAQEGRLGPHSIRLTPRDVEIVNGYAAIRASGWGPPPSGGGGKPSHEMANGSCCNRCAAGV